VNGNELWKTDGTATGTVIFKDIAPGALNSYPADFTIADGKLYFAADDGVHGHEPWVSDGSLSGTMMIKDTWPGIASGYDADL
jgi:ELWxxDGT repeat protein